MDFCQLTNSHSLLTQTSGSPNIVIGLIDGPIQNSHHDLEKNNLIEISSSSCLIKDSIACQHGTFIAAILKAKRGTNAPSICPDCTLVIKSIFNERLSQNEIMPTSSAKILSLAILECINAGAKLVNLSLALSSPTISDEIELNNVLDYAQSKGIIIVAAAGNQGTIGSSQITRHNWVIPVAASDTEGKPTLISNLSHTIGQNGFLAPGEKITSLGTNGKSLTLSGTSVATPIVTGIIALLWSKFPHLPAQEIKNALNIVRRKRTLVPPLVDADSSLQYLKQYEN